jgi:hypothetical protein|tara:strand:+ start:2525 stop:2701 length:177 start_codon:yes stop_codon:yes gene_type:complete
MPKKNTNSISESNLLSPINHIRFWKEGEMAYSALKKINELKAKNEMKKAKIILAEWFL